MFYFKRSQLLLMGKHHLNDFALTLSPPKKVYVLAVDPGTTSSIAPKPLKMIYLKTIARRFSSKIICFFVSCWRDTFFLAFSRRGTTKSDRQSNWRKGCKPDSTRNRNNKLERSDNTFPFGCSWWCCVHWTHCNNWLSLALGDDKASVSSALLYYI